MLLESNQPGSLSFPDCHDQKPWCRFADCIQHNVQEKCPKTCNTCWIQSIRSISLEILVYLVKLILHENDAIAFINITELIKHKFTEMFIFRMFSIVLFICRGFIRIYFLFLFWGVLWLFVRRSKYIWHFMSKCLHRNRDGGR